MSEKAGFGIRFVAWLIDVIILAVIQGVLQVALRGAAGPVGLLVGGAYSIGMIGNSGQTVGMMALHIKVIRTDGRPADFGVAALRWIGSLVSSCIIGIGYLFILFTPEKQALHDMIASTYVVKA